MKKIALSVSMTFLLAAGASAQIVPAKIQKYLDDNFTTSELGQWKKAGGACEGGKWLLTGDFNGDGRTDYLARIFTGRGRQQSLHLIGFINQKGDYTPDAFFEEEYTGDLTRSATSVLKKGTMVSSMLGSEGDGASTALKADVIDQYICETDASIMYAFKDGEFKNVQDPASLLDVPARLPGSVTPTPIPAPQPTPMPTVMPSPLPTATPMPMLNPTSVSMSNGDIPGIDGTYTIYDSSGNIDKNTGTVFFKDGQLTFKMSDGRAFSSATAIVSDGVISSGWGRTATVSSDGRTIFWSNKTRWVRK